MPLSTDLAAIRRGRAILDDYAEQNHEEASDWAALIGLLADLRAFSSARGLDFNGALTESLRDG